MRIKQLQVKFTVCKILNVSWQLFTVYCFVQIKNNLIDVV